MEKIKMVCAIALVSALSAGGAVPEGGLTWNLDASGVSGQTISGTFPNAEGVEGYAFVSAGGMIWTNDVGLTGIYRSLVGDELVCENATALYGNNPTVTSKGIKLPGATEALGLTNDFTLEFAIKVGATNPQWSRICEIQRDYVLNSAGTATNEASFAFIFQTPTAVVDGKTTLYIRIDSQSNHWERTGGFNYNYCSTTISVETWHFIAFSYEQSTRTAKLYVDGVLAATGTTTHRLQFDGTNKDLCFGTRFVGSIDCIRFTPRLLSAGELMWSYANLSAEPITGPTIGHWRFEGTDGASPTAAGLKSVANTLEWPVPTLSNGGYLKYTNDIYSTHAKYLVDGIGGDSLGVNAHSLYFTPKKSALVTFAPSRVSMQTNFTVECFFKDNGTSCPFSTILQKRRPDVSYIECVTNADETVTTNTETAANMSLWFMSMGASSMFIRADSVPETGIKPHNGRNWNQYANCTTPINDGKWHHLAITYDQETKKVTGYVDYKAEAVITCAYPLPNIPGSIIFGPNNTTTTRWGDYSIDEVRISDCVLPVERFLRFRAALGTKLLLK